MGKNILIAGVGGQGTLLASRVIGSAAIAKGYDVKVSEVHGMSQRGGSVVTHVKYAEGGVASPIIELGGADIVLAFEALEALRSVPYLKPDGVMLMNTQQINPMPVITGAAEYPADIEAKIRAAGVRLITTDAAGLAGAAGNMKTVNTVLIGVLSGLLDFERDIWEGAIRACVPEKLRDVNISAWSAGAEAAQ